MAVFTQPRPASIDEPSAPDNDELHNRSPFLGPWYRRIHRLIGPILSCGYFSRRRSVSGWQRPSSWRRPRSRFRFSPAWSTAPAPATSLDIRGVHVMEDGLDAAVTKVERLDWPVKIQLLLDNGVGLGEGRIQPLKVGVQALLAALPEHLEVTLVGTAPQPPSSSARPPTVGDAQGIELLGSGRGVGRLIKSLLERRSGSSATRATSSDSRRHGHDLG